MSDKSATLFQAITDGDQNQVALLLEQPMELFGQRNEAGQTPLLLAAYLGNQEIIQILRKKHPQPDLFETAILGDYSVLTEHLQADPDWAQKYSGDGWSALHLACFGGHLEAATALVDAGADLELISDNSTANTPLHAALAGAGNTDVVSLLLQAGAKVNATGAMDITPLHVAASRGDLTLIEMLLRAGAESQAMENGQTPAQLATERGHSQAASILETAP